LGQLKGEFRRRCAKIIGRKKDLVERLEAYDKNFDFNMHPAEQSEFEEYSMMTPDDTTYINAFTKMPRVRRKDIG